MSDRSARSRPAPILLALGLALLAAGTLVVLGLLTPLLLIAGALGAAMVLVFLQFPVTTCFLATLLMLWPFGARPVELDLLLTVAINGALAAALAALLLQVVGGTRELLLNPTTVALGLFIGWALVTTLWAPDLIEAKKTLVAYASGAIMVFVLTNQVRDSRDLDGLMTVLRILGWFLIVAGLYSLAQKGFHSGARLKVLEMNENEFGLVWIVTVPGVIWPVMRHRGWRRHVEMALSFVFLIIGLVLIALTGSRGSSVSLVVVMLSFLFSKPLRPWGVSSLIMCLLVFAAAPFVLSAVVARFASGEDGDLGGRDVLWRAGLMLLGRAPWTGVGIGNGPFRLHNDIASLTNIFNKRSDLPTHNPILEVGIDTGIIGICLYAAVSAAAFREFFSAAARANLRAHGLPGYFPLVLGIATGYFASWIKGGGVELHPTFFLILALLQIPSQLAWVGQPAAADARHKEADFRRRLQAGNAHG